jgi:hypothetical protein
MIPLQVSAQDSGDDIVIIPNQIINPRPNLGSVEIKFLEIQFNVTGEGVYFHIEFNNTMPVYIVNRSIYEYYTFTGGEINSSIAVNGMTFYAENTVDYKYIVPYNDTFYFFVTNSHAFPVTWDGWYAKDITTPIGIPWGIKSNQVITKGDILTIGCYYKADRFNITKLMLGLDIYPSRTENINTNGPINWTVELDSNRFPYFGNTYINFTVVDGIGNSNSVILNVYVKDPNSTTSIYSGSFNGFMIVVLVGSFGILFVTGIMNYYRNIKLDQKKEIEEKRKEKERKYHKTHRDSKGFKRAKK